jgi:hypothetical protein
MLMERLVLDNQEIVVVVQPVRVAEDALLLV